MPPWGRPPRGKTGVGRYMEEGEDVYRFQDLDSDDERNGVLVDQGYQPNTNGKFNPDELYFNDMDIRAWERRAAGLDDLYEEFSGYPEDEGYYDDAGELVTAAEYEELLFQRVLEKVRHARTTGDADVQLSQEELDAYQARLYRPFAPAARQPTVRARPSSVMSAPAGLNATSNSAIAAATSGSAGSGSSRSKKKEHRSSIFSLNKKKEKPGNRKRAPSNASEASTQAPGFVIPGPGGQPTYAPINSYQGRLERDPLPVPQTASRTVSTSNVQAQTPTSYIPQSAMPGAFPGGPYAYQPVTPTQQERSQPSTPQFTQEPMEYQHSPVNRSRSSSVHKTPSVVSLPVSYTGDSYQYHSTGQSSSAQASTSQVPYTRRVGSSGADSAYTAMPRRVPVPTQQPAPVPSSPASYSDPSPNHRSSITEDDVRPGVTFDTAAQNVKASTKEGTPGGSGSGGRKKKGRKNRN